MAADPTRGFIYALTVFIFHTAWCQAYFTLEKFRKTNKLIGVRPRDVMNNVLDCDMGVNKFETPSLYNMMTTSGDRTSDHRLQCRNSTTEPLVHIAQK